MTCLKIFFSFFARGVGVRGGGGEAPLPLAESVGQNGTGGGSGGEEHRPSLSLGGLGQSPFLRSMVGLREGRSLLPDICMSMYVYVYIYRKNR